MLLYYNAYCHYIELPSYTGILLVLETYVLVSEYTDNVLLELIDPYACIGPEI